MDAARHPRSTHRFTKTSLAWNIRRRERERGKVSWLHGGRFPGLSFRLAGLNSVRALMINWARE